MNGQLVLDGGKDGDGNTISGGGNWKGQGTTINTSEAMFVGNQTGSFGLAIDNGATVRTGEAFVGAGSAATGTVDLSGAGTLWEVQSGGMLVGGNGTGNFSIGTGAHLLLGDGTAFAVGFNSGSHGRMTVDGAGSVVDASKAETRIGAYTGSVGSLVLTNGVKLPSGRTFLSGKPGVGACRSCRAVESRSREVATLNSVWPTRQVLRQHFRSGWEQPQRQCRFFHRYGGQRFCQRRGGRNGPEFRRFPRRQIRRSRDCDR